jgi:hypothetical protein
VSNELIIKAAEAVDTLRSALELWCTRDDDHGSPLGVRGAADDASAAAAAAVTELAAIRNQVEREAKAYDQARRQHTDALLGEILVKPLASKYGAPSGRPVEMPEGGVFDSNADGFWDEPADYKCGDCGQVFPVDPADPIESHGAYLDHQAEHDDAEDDNGKGASIEDEQECASCGWPYAPVDPNCGHEAVQ